MVQTRVKDIHVRLTDDEYKYLDDIAKNKDMTKSQIVRQIVFKELREKYECKE